jgi:molybdopterin converting factor small subunit
MYRANRVAYAYAVPIAVKWFPTLVKRSKSRQDRTEVAWRAGLTPLAIFHDEGFAQSDADFLMVVVNGTQVELETPLADGDRIEFLVNIQGGAEGEPPPSA